jgi:hypothetical protein
MGKFIIVNWWLDCDPNTAAIITHENGDVEVFTTEEEATTYGNTELNGHFKVIQLEG